MFNEENFIHCITNQRYTFALVTKFYQDSTTLLAVVYEKHRDFRCNLMESILLQVLPFHTTLATPFHLLLSEIRFNCYKIQIIQVLKHDIQLTHNLLFEERLKIFLIY